MIFSKEQKIYVTLNGLVIVGLCASAITATKMVDAFFFVFPCSNVIFSLVTFPVTDVISEIWGKEYAKRTVWVSFFAQAVFVLFIQFSIYLPPASFWQDQGAYQITLGSTPRILLASMVAFLSSQICDVMVYGKLKVMTKGRFVVVRNNISTFSSQLVNSSLFITIAFYGEQPVLELITGSILLKWLIAVVDTPLVYFGIWVVHRKLEGKTLAYRAEA